MYLPCPPSTQPSHIKQPSVEDNGQSNCVKDVSVKRLAPPRPSPPTQPSHTRKQGKETSNSMSSKCPSTIRPPLPKLSPAEGSSVSFAVSATKSKSMSQTKSKYLHNGPCKPSTRQSNGASPRGHRKKSSTLQRNPPCTYKDITKSDEWDKEFYCEALYDFCGEMPCDLQFRKGQRIAIVTWTDSQDDWWERTVNGQTGIFPANYVSL